MSSRVLACCPKLVIGSLVSHSFLLQVFADTCSDNMVDYREFLRYFQIGADVEKYAFKPQMRMRTRIF